MFSRVLVAATRLLSSSIAFNTRVVIQNVVRPSSTIPSHVRGFHSVFTSNALQGNGLLGNQSISKIAGDIITRNVTKYSIRKGKRKSVKAVLKRFYRLHWGGWIRTKCGRHKKLWKKTSARKRRLRQHVFCNATQSTLLDKMVGSYWKKPKYYVDDPYEPYHTREEWKFTYTKPRPYFPPEQ